MGEGSHGTPEWGGLVIRGGHMAPQNGSGGGEVGDKWDPKMSEVPIE